MKVSYNGSDITIDGVTRTLDVDNIDAISADLPGANITLFPRSNGRVATLIQNTTMTKGQRSDEIADIKARLGVVTVIRATDDIEDIGIVSERPII